jgi:hypothetical protein
MHQFLGVCMMRSELSYMIMFKRARISSRDLITKETKQGRETYLGEESKEGKMERHAQETEREKSKVDNKAKN